MNVSQVLKTSKMRWPIARKGSLSFSIFLAKTIWVYPVFVAVVYFASGLFIGSETVRMVLAVVLSIFPWKEAIWNLQKEQEEHT